MSDILTVRDHSQPCPHAWHVWTEAGPGPDRSIVWKCRLEGCPGGREITLRKSYAEELMDGVWGQVWVEVDDDE